MKKLSITLLALLATGAIADVVSDNWDSAPAPRSDGRDGWSHNYGYGTENWFVWPQGDQVSYVEWATDGTERYIQSWDTASGQGEFFVAPTEYTVNGGVWTNFSKATLDFDFKRIIPVGNATSPDSLVVQIVSGDSALRLSIAPATIYSDFFTTNQWRHFTVNFLDPALTISTKSGSTPKTRDEILAAVDRVLIEGEVRSGSELNAIDNVVLTYNTGAGDDQSVSTNFNTGPTEDPRNGWKHNGVEDGYAGASMGDAQSRIYWDNDGFGNGFLKGMEAAQGLNDFYLAPARYIVNDGNFGRLASGDFYYEITRFYPATVAVASQSGVRIRMYSGSDYAERKWQPADLVDFYNATFVTFSPDAVLFDSNWTTNRASITPEEVLANVTEINIFSDLISGKEVSFLDNVRFTYENLPGVLTGTISLGDLAGDAPKSGTIEYREPGTTNVVLKRGMKIDPSGTYEAGAPAAGTYDVSIKVGSWLRKTLSNVAITSSSSADFSLINGDIDRDDMVTIFDYVTLSDYFDKSSADTDWNTVGANGFAPVDADVDRDGVVTIFDYLTISNNFDMSGDL
ncbi:MAG: hypothetical protein JST40_07355 [Armatimonadetes bacterium]|nr:hypothetical protein [Armatimonadota bacterium]